MKAEVRRLSPERAASSPAWTVIEIALLSTPFLWAAPLVASRLEPVEMADSFSYLWRAPVSFAYLTGRGLTQRILYSLAGNDPRAVACLQLACAAALVGGVQLLLRDREDPAPRVLLAAALAILSTSFGITVGSIVLDPDPVALCLTLGFPFVLVLARGRLRPWVVAGTGAATILSRSTAPAIVLVELAVVAAARVGRPGALLRVPVRTWAPVSFLALLAVLSALVTRTFDTSVGLNAANDILVRVLPDPALVRHFRHEHGMPTSESLAMLQGRNVLARVDGRALFRADPRTRTYELTPGSDPLLRWIATAGFGEYWKHILLHDPGKSLAELSRALPALAVPSTVMIRADYAESRAVDRRVAKHNAAVLLGSDFHEPRDFDERFYLGVNGDVADAVRAGRIASGRDHYDRFGRAEGRLASPDDVAQRRIPPGLLGFDPFAALVALLSSLGLTGLPVLLLALAASLGAARRWPLRRGFLLGAVLLAGGLSGFFLGYFGDAMDVERHVSASVVTLAVSACVVAATPMLAWHRRGRLARDDRAPASAS